MSREAEAGYTAAPLRVSGQVMSAVAQAKAKMAAGQSSEARDLLTGAIETLGDSALLHEQLGLLLFKGGEPSGAVVHLRKCVQLDPSRVEARILLLRAANNSNARAEAAEIAAETMAVVPNDVRLMILAAKAFRRNREFGRAGELWRQIARQRPNDVQPLVEASEALIRANDFAGALECSEKAIELDRSLEAPHILRLRTLEKMKAGPELMGPAIRDLAALNASAAMNHLPTMLSSGLYEAIADLITSCKRQGETLDPVLLQSLSKTLVGVARAAAAEHRFDAAARLWQALLAIKDDDKHAASGLREALSSLNKLGRNAVLREDFAGAAEIFRTLLAIDDTQARAWRELGSALGKNGQWQEAATMWLRCADVATADEREGFTLQAAKAARRIEAPADQLAALLKARTQAPNSAEVSEYGDRAVHKLVQVVTERIEAGAFDEAERDIRSISLWNKEHPKLPGLTRKLGRELNVRMRAADKRRDTEAALGFARLFLLVDPNNISTLNIAARSAFHDRRYDLAADFYSRLVEVDPDEERHYAKLGRAFKALRMYDRGIPIVMRLLEIHPGHPQGRQLLSAMLHGQEGRSA